MLKARLFVFSIVALILCFFVSCETVSYSEAYTDGYDDGYREAMNQSEEHLRYYVVLCDENGLATYDMVYGQGEDKYDKYYNENSNVYHFYTDCKYLGEGYRIISESGAKGQGLSPCEYCAKHE